MIQNKIPMLFHFVDMLANKCFVYFEVLCSFGDLAYIILVYLLYKKTGVKAIDGMMNIIWYESQIKRIGQGKKTNPELSGWSVFFKYLWLIIEQKLIRKTKKPVPNKITFSN